MGKKYTYKGAVYLFDKLITDNWEATTTAITKAKAISNLKYRFRQFAGIVNNRPIRFDGNLIEIT